MQHTKPIAIGIGLFIITAAFLSVFGSSLKNLTVDNDDAINVPSMDGTSPTATTTNKTTTKKPATVTEDMDDDVYDDDDIGTVPVTTTTTTNTTTTTPKPTIGGYTLTQVATHNSANSCWSAVNGSVYDLTNWVNAHPGGKAAILMICGKDGSPLFNSQHGSSGKVANILAKYKIGTLN